EDAALAASAGLTPGSIGRSSSAALVLRVGAVHDAARDDVVRDVALGDAGADPDVAADGEPFRQTRALADQRDAVAQMIGTGAIRGQIVAGAEPGPTADADLLVDDDAIERRVRADAGVVHDDAVAHRRPRRHRDAREQDRAHHLALDPAAVGD